MRRALVGVVLAAVSCARTTAQLPGIKTQRASVWLPFTEDGFPLPNLNRQSKQHRPERQLLGDPLVRSVEEGSEHRLPRRERGKIMLR